MARDWPQTWLNPEDLAKQLERAVRRYVRDGLCAMGLPPITRKDGEAFPMVISGNTRGYRPLDTYGSLLLMEDQREGYPIFRDLEDGRVLQMEYRRAVYSLQFYRAGAPDAAGRFDSWVQSENGRTYAETAFSDGRIASIQVLERGGNYSSVPDIDIIPHEDDPDAAGAEAEAILHANALQRIRIRRRGGGYIGQPRIEIRGGGGAGASASARGFGFRIDVPLNLRRIDGIESDRFEPRMSIDLPVRYARQQVTEGGLIEAIECEVLSGDEALVAPISPG